MVRTLLSLLLTITLFPIQLLAADKMETQEAIFAMGCFWCGESEYRDPKTHEPIPGVIDVKVGYAGGTVPNPTYENHPGYKEALKITFNPEVISYEKLLDIFWHNVDFTDADGQFCDRGFPYTSAIYYMNESQKEAAERSKDALKVQFDKPIVTEIFPYTTFYTAEDYHQNYKSKNPVRYKYYRWNCGRDKKLKEIWG